MENKKTQDPTGEVVNREPSPDDNKRELDSTRSRSASISSEGTPPPLPPRPKNLSVLPDRPSTSSSTIQRSSSSPNTSLQSPATTAVSLTDINTQSFQDGSREVYASSAGKGAAGFKLRSKGSSSYLRSGKGSDTGDSMSVRSYALNSEPAAETESLFGDVLGSGQDNSPWDVAQVEEGKEGILSISAIEVEDKELDFDKEFDPIGDLEPGGENEGTHMYIALYPIGHLLRQSNRSSVRVMEIEAKAFSDSFCCWKAHLLKAWRRWLDLWLHRDTSNDHIFLPKL
jgi:hypothetical protein